MLEGVIVRGSRGLGLEVVVKSFTLLCLYLL